MPFILGERSLWCLLCIHCILCTSPRHAEVSCDPVERGKPFSLSTHQEIWDVHFWGHVLDPCNLLSPPDHLTSCLNGSGSKPKSEQNPVLVRRNLVVCCVVDFLSTHPLQNVDQLLGISAPILAGRGWQHRQAEAFLSTRLTFIWSISERIKLCSRFPTLAVWKPTRKNHLGLRVLHPAHF